jgi:hypothetical protein
MIIPDPGSEFFPSWTPDPRSRIRIKEFKYLKIVSKLSGIGSWLDPDPDPVFYPSRIQGQKGTGTRIPAPQRRLVMKLDKQISGLNSPAISVTPEDDKY